MLLVEIPPSIVESAYYFVKLFALIVPLFIFASFLVGLVQEYMSMGRIQNTLKSRDEGAGNVVAAGLGAVTPFCSCSSIPVVTGLLQAGAPLGIVFSFLLASPLINEIAVPLLVGLFGWRITALYVLMMFIAALGGGFVIGKMFEFDEHVETEVLGTLEANSPGITDGGTSTVSSSHKMHFKQAASLSFGLLKEMLPYITLGMFVAALIHGLVPVSWLQTVLGSSNPIAVPLAVLAGVPLYFSLSSMLPVAYTLFTKGIPIGTVLALLVGTVGVSLPNLIMLNKLFSRRLLTLYVATVVAIGVTAGLVFNAVPI